MKISKNFPSIFEDKLLNISEEKRDDTGRMLSDLRADELEQNPIEGQFDVEYLTKVHGFLFENVSTHAGVIRDYAMSKGGTGFAEPHQMGYLFDRELPLRIEALISSINDKNKYIGAMTDLHSTLDLAHPFREGNGRTIRIFMSELAKAHGYHLDFSTVNKKEWVNACIDSISTGQESLKRPLFDKITTPNR